MRQLYITDTTISKSGSERELTFREKLEIAKFLDRLGVNTIELGGLLSLKADTLLAKSVAKAVLSATVSVSAGLDRVQIDNAFAALCEAKKKRIRILAPLSPATMEYLYHIKAKDLENKVREAVSYAASLCPDTEFCAEDATRADYPLLCAVLKTAAQSGAQTITIADSAGAMLPSVFGQFIGKLISDVPELSGVKIGVSCADTLNLSDACALSAIQAGACEVKTSAGDGITSLETFTKLVSLQGEELGVRSSLAVTEAGRLLENINKILGAQKTAGSPFEDGTGEQYSENIVLTKDDGIEAVSEAVEKLGYELTDGDRTKVYSAFLRVAEHKKEVGVKELELLVASEAMQVPQTYVLESYMVTTGNTTDIIAHVKLRKGDEVFDGLSLGEGPIDASFLAIEKITGCHYELDAFEIQAVTEGREAMGQTFVKLRSADRVQSGRGISTDIIGSALLAYISALNKIVFEEDGE